MKALHDVGVEGATIVGAVESFEWLSGTRSLNKIYYNFDILDRYYRIVDALMLLQNI